MYGKAQDTANERVREPTGGEGDTSGLEILFSRVARSATVES